MSPEYVRPYVKAQKNDDRDAEAIAEAATRPTMRFVAVKSEEQLDMQTLHRVRDRLVAERTSLMNQIRSSSRQSQTAQVSAHGGRPSVSSSGSASSPPLLRSPLVGASPPGGHGLSVKGRPSIDSFDSRGSFDVSQFEIVSPPRGSLTYPYNGLDIRQD